MSVTASLEELLYFWMDLFFCKRKEERRCFVKVVASFSREKNPGQADLHTNEQIRLKSLKKQKVQPLM